MDTPQDPIPFDAPILQPGLLQRGLLQTGLLQAPNSRDRRSADRSAGMILTNTNNGVQWEFTRMIEECNFGIVVQAQCNSDFYESRMLGSEYVAIKIVYQNRIRLRSEFSESPMDEISAMQLMGAQEGHPNVLEVIEVLEDEEAIYVILPWCDCGELFSLVQSSRNLRENQARLIFSQILDGVNFLHQTGVRICHRDLSLENIMMIDDCKVAKVIDFGLSLRFPLTGNVFTPQGNFGKMLYKSREIHEARSFDGAAIDVWTLGMMLFVMLTGSNLYQEPSFHDRFYRIVAVEHNLTRLLNIWGRNLSREAIDLIQGCLKDEPADRYTLPELLTHAWLNHD
jgi:serine/threonine protein kinase